MSYKLFITQDAYKDIDEIISYIVNVLKNPIAADNFLSEIEDNFNAVADNPEMYAYCTDKKLRNDGYRKFMVKNYIVFYRADKEENIVYIMRVIYGRRDYSKQI